MTSGSGGNAVRAHDTLEDSPVVGARFTSWTNRSATVDNSGVSTWSRVNLYSLVSLGGVGLLVAGWRATVERHATFVHGPHEALGPFGWFVFGVVPGYLVGTWVALKRPDHPQARRMLVAGSAYSVNLAAAGLLRAAAGRGDPEPWFWWANLALQLTGVVAVTANALALASFPDGTIERPWQRWGLWVIRLHVAVPPLLLLASPTLLPMTYLLAPHLLEDAPRMASPFAVPWLHWLAEPLEWLLSGQLGGLLLVAILAARFLRADQAQRVRMRLVAYLLAAISPLYMAHFLLTPRHGPENPVWLQLLSGVLAVLMSLTPVIIVVAILRHRLYDIDLVIRRSVVYGALSLGIAAVYLGLAAAPGLALGDTIPVELAVVLTIVAAVVFQPLRRRLERLADRLVFGERVNRYKLLTTFGASLEQTVALGELLPHLADTVRRGLAAPWVRVTLPGVDVVAGTVSGSGDAALRVGLERGGEVVGHIECGPKDGGYQPGDRELLDTLAGQAATAIANAQLTTQLGEQVNELARSRSRIVAAQDTERRRIERNIHDGAQQHVVALIMKLRLARNQLDRGDRSTDEVLDELQRDAQGLLTDLRELAHGVHPPVLSDQGLVAAVQARADRMPLNVRVHAEPALYDQRLGTEIEGAAYFVICEALTNVVKHAAARTAGVRLSTKDGKVVVRVRDDGVGFTSAKANGNGLTNLRDRVEALGGHVQVDSSPGTGTKVHAELPIGAHHG
ncbi:histidine kinase [Actinophytocola sp.]|uniref:sensor histidine kinase n=1 Tax=Actinophytocola sp. TaxID=1872138 RepID=UPI003D6B33F6